MQAPEPDFPVRGYRGDCVGQYPAVPVVWASNYCTEIWVATNQQKNTQFAGFTARTDLLYLQPATGVLFLLRPPAAKGVGVFGMR